MEKQNKEVLLHVDHLCQYFKGVKAVDDVTFDIYKGEVFGLVGESGCGKTTTGRSIIRIYDITSGSIYFKGQRVCAGTKSYVDAIKAAKRELKEGEPSPQRAEELKAAIADSRKEIRLARHDHKKSDQDYARKLVLKLKQESEGKDPKKLRDEIRVASNTRLITQIQMIFQDPVASLNPRMTVREIIAEGLIIRGVKDQAYIDEKVYEILDLVGLTREHAGRYPHEFSGGQKQRIGIARAVIMQPDLLIADEPVSALDVSIQAQVINLLNELRERLGLTILFIAHDLSVVKYFSDRIGVMYFGKMVELATSDELFAHPMHPYTRSLLSAIPLPDPRKEKGRVRIKYDPLEAHDYSEEQPAMQEVTPGHFVLCSDSECQTYRKELELN